MKSKKRFFSMLVLAVAFLSAEALHGESIKFVYARYFPANYLNDEGRHRGFFVEIIEELLGKRLGLDVRMETLPWVRCQLLVERGEADLFATIPTAERLAYTVIVEPPIWIKKYRLYTYAGNPETGRINAIRSIEDLRVSGLTVISYIGNSWSKNVLEDADVKVVNAIDVEGMYRMLAARRADLLVEDPLLAGATLASYGLSRNIVLTDGVVGESRFNLMIGKLSAFANRASAMGRELERMRSDGTIERIMRSYR